MKVRPTNQRYVYEVESDTQPGKWYEVDLTGNAGATFCPCRDFQTRRQPAIDRGEPPLTPTCLCKHGKAALWFFIREILPRLAQRENTPPRKV